MAQTRRQKITSILLVLCIFTGILACYNGCFGVETVYGTDEDVIQYENTQNANDKTGENLYTKLKQTGNGKNSTEKKLKVAMDYYDVPMEECSWIKHPTAGILNGMSNLLFGFGKGVTKLSGKFVAFAMDFDLFDKIDTSFNRIFGKFKTMVSPKATGTGTFIIIGIAITMVMAALALVRRNTSSALSSIGKIIIILICGTLFFTAPMKLLATGNEMTKAFGASILKTAENSKSSTMSGGSAKKVGENANKLLWKVGIDYPWQELTFGEICTGTKSAYEKINKNTKTITDIENPSKNIAASATAMLNTSSEARENGISDKWVERFSSLKATNGAQATNVGTSLMIFLLDLILCLVVLALGILLIATQMLALLLALVGLAVLILAFFPSYGFNIIKKWGMNLLTCFIVQIVVYFILCVVFVILDFVYSSLITQIGILAAGLFVIAMVVMLLIFKGQIMELFGGNGTAGRITGVGTGAVRKTAGKSWGMTKGGVKWAVGRRRHQEMLNAMGSSSGGSAGGSNGEGVTDGGRTRSAPRGVVGSVKQRRQYKRGRKNDVRRQAATEAQSSYLQKAQEIKNDKNLSRLEKADRLATAKNERRKNEKAIRKASGIRTGSLNPNRIVGNKIEQAGIRSQMKQEQKTRQTQENLQKHRDEKAKEIRKEKATGGINDYMNSRNGTRPSVKEWKENEGKGYKVQKPTPPKPKPKVLKPVNRKINK